MSKVIEEVISEIIPEDTVETTVEESIGIIVIEIIATTEAGRDLKIDHFQVIMAVSGVEVQIIVDQVQDPELVLIGIE